MKLRLALFIILATIAPLTQALAQDILDIYDQKTIYLYYDFSGSGFVKNGQVMPLGIFCSNLAEEVSGSEHALAEMKEARKYRIMSVTSGLVATAVQIASIAIYLWDKDYVSKPGFQIATIGIGGIAGIFSLGFDRSAMRAMNTAVWLYNRDVVSGQIRIRIRK